MCENHKNEACKTYLEQTKLLVTLASAFIIAPIALFEKFQTMDNLTVLMEISFILSIFAGYVVFGSVSGTQYKGECNVYNIGTRIFSWVQIGLFFIGILLMLINISDTNNVHENQETTTSESFTSRSD